MSDPPSPRRSQLHVHPQVWMLRAAFRTMGVVAPGIAARWAETIFCRPPRSESRPAESGFLAAGEGFTIPAGPHRLAAWRWGSGPVVLLVHGWGSRAGRFAVIGPALVRAGFTVVAYDGPAHGDTPGTSASLPEFAAALGAVGETLGPVHAVVGHSLGGAALALALSRGLVAGRAVLIAAPADVKVFSSRFAAHLDIPRPVWATVERNLQRRLGFSWPDLHIPSLAERQRVPALVVHDRDDPDVPFAEGEAITRAWPGARLVATAGLGHRAILRSPDVAAEIVGFVSNRAGAER